MTSDRESQFTSELWSVLSQLHGTRLHCTSAYHPQSNGLVERFHRHLKSALMARLHGHNWLDELPWILLGIRTAPKEDLGCSSAELVYGAPLTVPGDFVPRGQETQEATRFLPRLRETVRDLAPRLSPCTAPDRRSCRPLWHTAPSSLCAAITTAHPSHRLTRDPTRF